MANIAKGFFGIPETAICTFERWSGLQVGLHDLQRSLQLHIPTTRVNHRNLFCDLLKSEGYEPECKYFEADQLRPQLSSFPEGCIKRCHAGIVELSVPILIQERLAVVLFAGLCRAGDELETDFIDSHVSNAYQLWPENAPTPRSLDNDQAQLYLEGLRQLAARLKQWLLELAALDDDVQGPAATRRQVIHRFISRRFRERVVLDDLAKLLCLSRSRTAHLVREVCGQPFIQLITNVRVRHAGALLRQTDLPVSEVAMRSGFGDVSNFHKAFRRSFDISPLKYRQRNAGGS